MIDLHVIYIFLTVRKEAPDNHCRTQASWQRVEYLQPMTHYLKGCVNVFTQS